MKDKSFKTSYTEMYMVTPEIYNRLLNNAERTDKTKLNDLNETTHLDQSQQTDEVVIPDPINDMQTKLKLLERKMEAMLENNHSELMGNKQFQNISTQTHPIINPNNLLQNKQIENSSTQTTPMKEKDGSVEMKDTASQTFPASKFISQNRATQTILKEYKDQSTETPSSNLGNVEGDMTTNIEQTNAHKHGDTPMQIVQKEEKKSDNIYYPKSNKSTVKVPKWKKKIEQIKKTKAKPQGQQKVVKVSVPEPLEYMEDISNEKRGKKRKATQHIQNNKKIALEKESTNSVFACKTCKNVFSSSIALKEHNKEVHKNRKNVATKRKQKVKIGANVAAKKIKFQQW